MTELSPVCHMTPFENNKLGSVGMLLPNLRCKVRVGSSIDTSFCDWLEQAHTVVSINQQPIRSNCDRLFFLTRFSRAYAGVTVMAGKILRPIRDQSAAKPKPISTSFHMFSGA